MTDPLRSLTPMAFVCLLVRADGTSVVFAFYVVTQS